MESQDGMTADWVKLPYEILETLATRIINEVKGVNPDQNTGQAAASSTSPASHRGRLSGSNNFDVGGLATAKFHTPRYATNWRVNFPPATSQTK